MADTKISALSSATTLGGTEILAGVQAAASVGITANQLKTWASTSPTLVTPTLGVATATSVNKLTLTAPATGATLTLTDGKTLAVTNSLTLSGTDSTVMTFPSVTASIPGLAVANTFSATQTFNASGSIALGANSGNLGSIKLFGSTSGDVTVKPAAAAGTATVFQLPATNGTVDYVLRTDGNGVTSWVAQSGGGGTPGGSTTQLQYNNSSAFAGAAGLTTDGTNLTLGSSSALLWSTDLILGRNAAASLRLGAADAATATAQTLGVQSVATGNSNVAGADFTIAGSKGTGNAAGGSILFQVAPAGGSGTSPNALVTAVSIDSTKACQFAGNGGFDNSGNIQIPLNNAGTYLIGGQVCLKDTGFVAFGSTAFANGSTDTFISRSAAASLRLGAADAASPVAQTLGVQSVVTGTSNTAGADFTIKGSAGTGSGAGGSIKFSVAPGSGGGTSPNSYGTPLVINGSSQRITANSWETDDGVLSGFTAQYYASTRDTTQRTILLNSAAGTINLFATGKFGFTASASGTDVGTTLDTTLTRVAAGVVKIAGASGTGPGVIVTLATTVASLPSASTAGAGARCFVTDANATTFLSTVAAGGANKVPVVSDGTNWLIG